MRAIDLLLTFKNICFIIDLVIILNKYIMHIDVNNAFLSWTAIYLIKNGEKEDIRLIPAVIGGDEATRHGVVLAKSNIAKQFGIKTGETIYQAKKKCPQIRVFPTRHEMYKEYSDKLYNLLLTYTNKIERFSIDECFIDFSDIIKSRKDFLKLAIEISQRIKKELLFTVNIGLSDNKILAKMASDFEKPDKIHTLYKEEIEEKMWNLPIEDLFMVGRKSAIKLKSIGINKIKDLAVSNKKMLTKRFGKFGATIWENANGLNNEEVIFEEESPKSIGNSVTLPKDCSNINELNKILLSLSEKVGYRIRKSELKAYTVGVQIKTNEFIKYSHQKKLNKPTANTQEIYNTAKELLEKLYINQQIRLIGVKLDNLTNSEFNQISIFEQTTKKEKNSKIDKVIDNIKDKYGYDSITLGTIMDIDNQKD